MLNYKQAAELLGVNERTIYNLIRRGDLRASKLGRSPNSPVRIDPADLAAYLEATKASAGRDAAT
jgi:excisionase family DNA binding protein